MLDGDEQFRPLSLPIVKDCRDHNHKMFNISNSVKKVGCDPESK